ncbi:hypothetical protein TURU_065284 [Turdus rufiventris]|nr:hypothetical protein TURU_065284 [Turdus rufiventris]
MLLLLLLPMMTQRRRSAAMSFTGRAGASFLNGNFWEDNLWSYPGGVTSVERCLHHGGGIKAALGGPHRFPSLGTLVSTLDVI